MIGGRTFVNNASFGAYAEIVQSPEYRDDKARTTLQHAARPARRPSRCPAGRARRGRHDRRAAGGPGEQRPVRLHRSRRAGTPGRGSTAASSAWWRSPWRTPGRRSALLRRSRQRGLIRFAAAEVVVDADAAEIPVGIDGEAILMPTPVRCTTVPAALRVRVPKNRPGVPPAKPAVDWVRLRRLAFSRGSSRAVIPCG